ncbi:MAG: zinc ribbon domain-containing protein [Ignavibacteriales bacterium]|nr:zinc ribbon domain-containing protein [Ignavibacteriales bacterium]
MPIYDYRCADCSKTYDIFHKVREVFDDIVCPSCGSTNYKKLMSVTQVSMGSDSNSSCADGSCSPYGGGGCAGGMCGLN